MLNKMLVAGAIGTLLVVTPRTNAQMGTPNEVSGFTLTESIEVAGTIVPPGSYVIKVVNQTSGETYNRNVIQITNEDGSKVIVTAGANPRPAKTDPSSSMPLFEYYTAQNGQPKALRTWYPAGTKTGRDIVYPRKRAIELASITKETIPSIPDETKETELATVAVTPVAPEPAPKPAAQKPAAVVAESRPELPATASREPLFAGLGLLALAGAFALHLVARRGV